MKALTLTQPWASLMHLREKTIETRSWSTSYRGPVVIHAAKGFPKWAKELCSEEPFANSLNYNTPNMLPLSRGLCVVELLACIPTTELYKVEAVLGHKPDAKELEFGDYAEGRFAWVTRYVQSLYDERIVKGALGLWEWNDTDQLKVSHTLSFLNRNGEAI